MLSFLRRCALTLLPKNIISRLHGTLASWENPRWFVLWHMRWFAKTFALDMSETTKSLDEFKSLQDLFTRPLKADARPIDENLKSIVSPCDGFWGQSGRVERGTLLQIKGKTYSLASLLGTNSTADFEGGHYVTLYLSPKDYHCFHSPVSCDVVSAKHIPGYLWPVNNWAVKNIDELFCVNERIVVNLKADSELPHPNPLPHAGEGVLRKEIVYVAVGATMVGKVKLEFDETLTTNNGKQTELREYKPNQHHLKKGDKLGRFEFGSTLVLVFSPALCDIYPKNVGTPVKMGEHIGFLK